MPHSERHLGLGFSAASSHVAMELLASVKRIVTEAVKAFGDRCFDARVPTLLTTSPTGVG